MTIDETGVKSVEPKRQAEAYATRIAAESSANERALKLETEKQAQAAEAARLKTIADAEAYKARVLAEAQARAEETRLEEQARAGVQASQVMVNTLSVLSILGAMAAVVWISGKSISSAYNSMQSARLVKIGVDPLTLQPPAIIITDSGMMIDTRTGERARLRDTVGVNQVLLAAVTHNLDMAMMTRTADRIASANSKPNSGGAQVADQLASIAEAVPVIITQKD